MAVYDPAHNGNATVTYFHVVLVKDGVQIMFWWELPLD